MTKKKKQFERRLPKTALNVIREVSPGEFQVLQLYGPMEIPLLGYRYRGEFIPKPARTQREAFEQLEREYYE